MELKLLSFRLIFSLTFHVILVLFFHLSIPKCASAAILKNATDKFALLDFKSKITEDPLGVLNSWNDSLHLCRWTGVKCGAKHQKVVSLDLKGQSLAGNISPHVGNLSFLRFLDLAENFFHGGIPPELGLLARLQTMNLSNNFLAGEIPENLSHCSNLLNLALDHNYLEGHIPPLLGSLSKLVTLYLRNNNLTGRIPASIGNLTSLQDLYISYNDLEGQLPDTMAQLTSLRMLGLSVNSLSGEFPPVLYNLSSLVLVGLSFNNFTGTLRTNIGLALPALQLLYLANNSFTGPVPVSLTNVSGLQRLDIPINKFTGSIPKSFGNLLNLWWFNVANNNLGNDGDDDLSFLTSLTNCSKLEFLGFNDNQLGGMFPNAIANLSTTLVRILIGGNGIRGSIPEEITNLVNLNVLSMRETFLTGNIPTTIGKLSNLGRIYLESNQLTGKIPSSIGNITQLVNLNLSYNSLEGNIPSSLGNCIYLQSLDLSLNKLNGTIPKKLASLSSLSVLFNLADNSLTGLLPEEVGNLTNLVALDVSNNQLSGEIPRKIGKCVTLEQLYMQNNSFWGSIPPLDNLKSIRYLDLSRNNLSGLIPQNMVNLPSLLNLNLSFNNLEGAVPLKGIFQNATEIQVLGNSKLCGGIQELHLQPCFVQSHGKPKKRTTLKLILVIVSIVSCLALLSSFLSFCWVKKLKNRPHSESSGRQFYPKISYEDLLNATSGFSSSNLIGSGSVGAVYKGSLAPDATIVAVKVLKLQQRGASKSFIAECEALRNIRHRNLVKVLSACSSITFEGNEFKAIVYQYMPNGSLEDWLHPKAEQLQHKNLSILQRLNIAVDVASALHYLHHQCQTPVVHCDLKPSNVLLDEDLTAHVSDFGLARLLPNSSEDVNLNQFSSLGIKGTIGYAAPGNFFQYLFVLFKRN